MSCLSCLTLSGLEFSYRNKTPILTGIDLEIQPGELVLIAGATGSGKSTLLNSLVGIAPSYSGGELKGEILYGTQSLLALSIRERAKFLGAVLQNVETQIFTNRVSEEIAFGLENRNFKANEIQQRVPELLQEFGLSAQSPWTIKQLSAGQKQRLVLASVLVLNQPIVVLDEPLAYLDQQGTELLLQILQARVHQGQAVIIVEHRTDLVAPFAQRIVHTSGGKLLPGLPPQRVLITDIPPTQPRDAVIVATQDLAYGTYPAYPDLRIQTGEAVLLKGGNGCGKTTLLKLLSGLLKPTRGTLQIDGQDVLKQKITQTAQRVGFVLQNPNHQLFAESVQEEIAQPGVNPDWAKELLERLNLVPQSTQHPQSLSQGQKRRLALGAVLARRPQICLLDEITVGQDPDSLLLMLKVLQDFTQQGGTLVLTSHDPQASRYLDARIVPLGAQ